MTTIYFDMDGTLCDLYGVSDWLRKLKAEDASPYREARPLLRLSQLARQLNKLQSHGYRLGIVSWLAKESSDFYGKIVTEAKLEWLHKHLASVNFDEIFIVPYGTPKYQVVTSQNGILFDDEEKNRREWTGVAYDVQNILEILKGIE